MKSFKLTLAFLMLSAFIVQAQDVKSIIDTNKRWSVMHYSVPPTGGENKHTVQFKLDGDTLINGKEYKVIFSKDKSYLIDTSWREQNKFLRKEKSTNKIYYRVQGEEYLLYDFSVTTGDTITHFSTMPTPGYKEEAYIGNIDSIMINGKYHKRIEIKGCQEEYWIEGIGSTLGLIYTYCAYDLGSHLLCCYKNSKLIYSNNAYNSCYISSVAINDYDKEWKSQKIKVYPTIAYTSLTVNNEYKTPVKLNIYNVFGKEEKDMEISNGKTKIDCSFLKKGIYILTFKINRNQPVFKTKKIIKK